jgi:hypothetical protein
MIDGRFLQDEGDYYKSNAAASASADDLDGVSRNCDRSSLTRSGLSAAAKAQDQAT